MAQGAAGVVGELGEEGLSLDIGEQTHGRRWMVRPVWVAKTGELETQKFEGSFAC